MNALAQSLWDTIYILTGIAFGTAEDLYKRVAPEAKRYLRALLITSTVALVVIPTLTILKRLTGVMLFGYLEGLLAVVFTLVLGVLAAPLAILIGMLLGTTVDPRPVGQKYLRVVGIILFAELMSSAFLLIVPTQQNIEAIPLLILFGGALFVGGLLYGGTGSGRSYVKLAMAGSLIVSLSFFLPESFGALGGVVTGSDKALASILRGEMPVSNGAPITQQAQAVSTPYQPPSYTAPPTATLKPPVRWIERTVEVGPGWTTFNIPIPDQFIVNIYSGYGGCFNIRYPEGGYWGDGTTVPTGYTVTCPNSQDRIPGASVIELGANRNVRIQLKYAYRP